MVLLQQNPWQINFRLSALTSSSTSISILICAFDARENVAEFFSPSRTCCKNHNRIHGHLVHHIRDSHIPYSCNKSLRQLFAQGNMDKPSSALLSLFFCSLGSFLCCFLFRRLLFFAKEDSQPNSWFRHRSRIDSMLAMWRDQDVITRLHD